MKPKICKNCKHYETVHEVTDFSDRFTSVSIIAKCVRTRDSYIDLVNGEHIFYTHSCETERKSFVGCGVSGKYYEPRE